MGAFNNEIASVDKIGLHLSEIGRLQNNAGSALQFMAILFAICIYFFNALVYPETAHRMLYGSLLALNALLIAATCFLYIKCLTLSVGWIPQYRNPKTGFHLLSCLSDDQIEKTLFDVVRFFRRGTYCFFLTFFNTFLLIVLVAFGELNMLPL